MQEILLSLSLILLTAFMKGVCTAGASKTKGSICATLYWRNSIPTHKLQDQSECWLCRKSGARKHPQKSTMGWQLPIIVRFTAARSWRSRRRAAHWTCLARWARDGRRLSVTLRRTARTCGRRSHCCCRHQKMGNQSGRLCQIAGPSTLLTAMRQLSHYLDRCWPHAGVCGRTTDSEKTATSRKTSVPRQPFPKVNGGHRQLFLPQSVALRACPWRWRLLTPRPSPKFTGGYRLLNRRWNVDHLCPFPRTTLNGRPRCRHTTRRSNQDILPNPCSTAFLLGLGSVAHNATTASMRLCRTHWLFEIRNTAVSGWSELELCQLVSVMCGAKGMFGERVSPQKDIQVPSWWPSCTKLSLYQIVHVRIR